jgi:peptide chain release factor 1
MSVLRARLLEMEQERQAAERGEERRSQVGSGERSEKIRTYNFKENRITDHRINFTMHQLGAALEGDLDELVNELEERTQADKLRQATATATPDDE